VPASPAAGPLPYTVTPDVLEAELGGEAVLLHLGTKRYFQLNVTGLVVWAAVRDRLTEADVVRRLGAEFGAPPDEARSEMRRLLEELVEQELVSPAVG
jgi:Coenzyme PQQ synthesis protein D (PqqD)